MIETVKITPIKKGSILKDEMDFFFCPVGTEAMDIENDVYEKRPFGWTFIDQLGKMWIFSNLEMSSISEDVFVKILSLPPPN